MNSFFYGFSGVLALVFVGAIVLAPVLAISVRIAFQPFARRFDLWLERNDHERALLLARVLETDAKLERLRTELQVDGGRAIDQGGRSSPTNSPIQGS